MMPARSLAAEQRQAVIAGIRKEVIEDNRLQSMPDSLLLIVLYALTGRHADMASQVFAASTYRHYD